MDIYNIFKDKYLPIKIEYPFYKGCQFEIRTYANGNKDIRIAEVIFKIKEE